MKFFKSKERGVLGVGPGRFTDPAGITVDSSDLIYVTDLGNPENEFQVFTNNGTFIRAWGSQGLQEGQFVNASGIAVDSSGCLFLGKFAIYTIRYDAHDRTYIDHRSGLN